MATNISNLTLNAPIQKVWDTLTQPSQVKLWQFGSDLTTDWKVGSEIRFRTEWEGQIFEQWGKILAIMPNKMLKYSLFAPRPDLEDKPENYFIMSYILTQEPSHVQLQIIQEDNRAGAKQEPPQGEENPILMGLKALIEN
jgi:uncharacterized protein YndB with AHSA1/START domain